MAKLLINLKRGKDESQLTITNKVTGKEVENSTVEIFKAMTEDRLVNFKIININNHGKKLLCKVKSTIDKDSFFLVFFEQWERCKHEPHFNNDENKLKGYFGSIRKMSNSIIEDCKTKLVKTFEEKYQHGDINIIQSLYENHLGDVEWKTTLEDIKGNTVSNSTVDILLNLIGKELLKDNIITVEMSKATTDTIICSFMDSIGNIHTRNFKTETSLKQSWSLEKVRYFLTELYVCKDILIDEIKEANKYNSIIEFEV